MPAVQSLHLAPFTPEIHAQVVGLYGLRKTSPPPMPKLASCACSQDGVLVAAMYLYETDLFLFTEFLVTNPEFPARHRHLAVMFISQAAIAVASAKSLFIMTTPRTRGGELMAKRFGFVNSKLPMFVRKRIPMPLWRDPLGDVPSRPVAPAKEELFPELEEEPSPTFVGDKSEAPPPARKPLRGRKQGAEGGPAKGTLRRVSRQGKRSGLG